MGYVLDFSDCKAWQSYTFPEGYGCLEVECDTWETPNIHRLGGSRMAFEARNSKHNQLMRASGMIYAPKLFIAIAVDSKGCGSKVPTTGACTGRRTAGQRSWSLRTHGCTRAYSPSTRFEVLSALCLSLNFVPADPAHTLPVPVRSSKNILKNLSHRFNFVLDQCFVSPGCSSFDLVLGTLEVDYLPTLLALRKKRNS